MLNNTYDASGIQFGILLSRKFPYFNDSIFLNDYGIINQKAVFDVINMEGISILEFKYVDGLALNEINNGNNYIFKNTILFVVYNKILFNTASKELIENITDNNILYYIIISIDKSNENKRIDEIVEEVMLNNYHKQNEKVQRIMRCFLERHRYGSKEKTDAKIKEYLKNN